MTEREKLDKATRAIRAKHPEIRDPAELRQAAERLLARREAVLLLGFPALLFLGIWYFSYYSKAPADRNMPLFRSAVFFLIALELGAMSSVLSRRKRCVALRSDTGGRDVLTRSALPALVKKEGAPLPLVIGLLLLTFFVWFVKTEIGRFDWRIPWTLVGLALFLFCLLISRKTAKENEQAAADIRAGRLFFVRNQLTDKEAVDNSSGDTSGSFDHYLYFHKTAGEGRRSLRVDNREYRSAQLGDEYYLLFIDRKLWYAFSARRYSLDPDLSQMLVEDPEVVGVP